MVLYIHLPKLPSAKETVEVMLHQVFHVHRFPKDIVSDWGPQFVTRFWREFCFSIGVEVSLPSGYHPPSNGQTERLNQELETCLRCLVFQNPASCSSKLMWVEFAHKSLPTSATGLTLFQCAYGYQPPRCHRVWAAGCRILTRSAGRMKMLADCHHVPVPVCCLGQKVWLSTKDLPLHVKN